MAKNKVEKSRTSEPVAAQPKPPPASFPIVGVGASAGGLEALTELLHGLPPDTGMAFVVVQHLAAKHDSILASLLGRATAMPVLEAEEGLEVEPNHVYVIPPQRDLLLRDGHLGLAPRPDSRGERHMPIDLFLRTLAENHDDLMIGVVLSGTGSDGTLGLRAVKEAGGIAIAQEPATASYDAMPRSAIANASVDFILPPPAIGAELARLADGPRGRRQLNPALADEDPFRQILMQVRRSTGSDFSSYKKTTLLRRIRRRMLICQVERLRDYQDRLEADPAEVAALHQDLLINVTSFFRDPETFEFLASEILPKLFTDRPADSPLRVWVPGCSTGEEAYSLAICILETSAALGRNPTVQLFASDISEKAIERARSGVYLENIAADVSPERLARFFTRLDGQFQVSKAVRDLCIFARQDVTRDPPFSRLDFISCRNLLIYLESNLQQRVLASFHYALGPGRYLMLGRSETVGASSDCYLLVDREHRVYSKLATASPYASYRKLGAGVAERTPAATPTGRDLPAPVPPLQREAQRILSSRFSPASVLVNANLDALELRGDTEPFLGHRPGDASLNLLRMVRPELTAGLRQALREARTSLRPHRREGLTLRGSGRPRRVTLEVVPVAAPGIDEPGFLVVFEGASPKRRAAPAPRGAKAGAQLHTELEQELEAARQQLQSTIESSEATQEELQSANEEILSSNEELQSINEELETAKEELQSGNEELTTLNEELHTRNLELTRTGDDLANVLESVGVPIVVVGGDLVLRRFTPAASRLLNLIPGDVGRPLSDIRPNLTDVDLVELVREAAATVTPIEREVPAKDGCTYSLRVRPYRTRDHRIDGAVLVFLDVSELKQRSLDDRAALRGERDATRRAEKDGRLKEEVVGVVSHELRGPLNAMVGWLHILREDQGDAETSAKALNGIDQAVKLQLKLVEDLLDFTRIESGQVQLNQRPLSVVPLIQTVLTAARETREGKRITLALTPETTEELVFADLERLQQILWNLVSNATKFTPEGGRVDVGVARRGTHVEIAVRDTGRGISAQHLPHIFERMRQSAAGDRRGGGLGLGLSIVRHLVEMHGGKVHAESEGLGLGAVFTVVLPLPPLDALPTRPLEGTDRGPAADALEDLHVLLVEDDREGREVLEELLRMHGAEVVAVASGEEATEAMNRSLPDVVVSDVGLPDENGYELIRRIRSREPARGGQLPAIALTAYATPEDRRRALAAGFDEHIAKPAAARALIAAVARVARKK